MHIYDMRAKGILNLFVCCFCQCDTEIKHLNKNFNPKVCFNEHHLKKK